MINIILICGYKGTGKDTVADMLSTRLNKGYEGQRTPTSIISNAKTVKDVAFSFFKWNGFKDSKGRRLLQDVTRAGYNYDPEFWEKKTYNLIKDCIILNESINTFIIPDWRYLNTLHFFKNKEEVNVLTIRVNKHYEEDINEDISEQQFKHFLVDYEIDNNGSLEDLYQNVNKLVEDLGGKYGSLI